VKLYVSEEVNAKRWEELGDNAVEDIWMEVNAKNLTVLICNVYRPPSALARWMEDFAAMMKKAAGETLQPRHHHSGPRYSSSEHSLVELIIMGKFMDLEELPPAKGFGKMPSALSRNVEGIYENCTTPSCRLCAVKEAHPRSGYMDAMLCHLFSCTLDEAPRKGPNALDVLGCNCPSEQEIQMAILDYLRPVLPPRGSRHRQDGLVKD